MVFLLVMMLAAHPNPAGEFLPQWMTPEESLRADQIGETHVVTTPPGCWVETPGEFEQLRGVFITWRYEYGSSLDYIFYEIVREVAGVSKAYIIVRSGTEQSNVSTYLTNHGVPLDSVTFMMFPNNSIWMRDYGPWFMRKEDNSEGICDFIYNRPRPEDDTIPWRIGNAWSIPVYGSPLEHPGGNFMVDGLGTGFASDLIYDENSGFTSQEIESLMLEYCGLHQFIVLPQISIEYTKHIDLWTKILNDTLVLVGEYESGHPNHTILNQNAALIESKKNREGINYRVARMPMPWSTSNSPPSYLNSLMVNGKVLVPLWNELEDDTAQIIYQQLLPTYDIVGINCSSMSGWGGAIHCITMQAPSDRFLHVKHEPLPDTTFDTLNPYRVRTEIITSNTLIPDSSLVYYRINGNPVFSTDSLVAVGDTPGVYVGYIPAQSPGDTVYYFLQAKNNDGIRKRVPSHAPIHVYSFLVAPGVSVYSDDIKKRTHEFSTFPNPVHTRVFYSFSLEKESEIEIEIFNILGQKVSAVKERYNAGHHTVEWDLRDTDGTHVSRGIYFFTVTSDEWKENGKMIIMK
jgi:agmatine deiminase